MTIQVRLNGFGSNRLWKIISMEQCPACGEGVQKFWETSQVQQVAELVNRPIEIIEYHRPNNNVYVWMV